MRIAAALALGAVVAAWSIGARAQTTDERASARDVVKKRGDAVVMVLATIKLRINIGGREQSTDQATQANATVLDGTGLTVLSLSSLQPDDVMTRTLSQRVPSGTKVDVTSELSDMRMHLADGREIAAKLVLRDEDLDLAFVRPTEAPATPMTSVDSAVASPGILDPVMLVQRTSEATGWQTAASLGNVQLVIDKPRTYYQIAMPTTGGNGLGSPVFDLAGHFVGVVVLRNTGSRGSASPGVLPGSDIRDIAKQAPAVK
ncbi:MAG TPA: serine protease [Vicinamibacterales bacterium]|nr:serine protease [Vicinamibacterales bacterium]